MRKSKGDIMDEEKKRNQQCEVNIHFSVPKDKREHILNAEKELRQAGVSFDTGASMRSKGFERDWEFDWSLSDNVKVSFRKFKGG